MGSPAAGIPCVQADGPTAQGRKQSRRGPRDGRVTALCTSGCPVTQNVPAAPIRSSRLSQQDGRGRRPTRETRSRTPSGEDRRRPRQNPEDHGLGFIQMRDGQEGATRQLRAGGRTCSCHLGAPCWPSEGPRPWRTSVCVTRSVSPPRSRAGGSSHRHTQVGGQRWGVIARVSALQMPKDRSATRGTVIRHRASAAPHCVPGVQKRGEAMHLEPMKYGQIRPGGKGGKGNRGADRNTGSGRGHLCANAGRPSPRGPKAARDTAGVSGPRARAGTGTAEGRCRAEKSSNPGQHPRGARGQRDPGLRAPPATGQTPQNSR